MGSIRKPSHLSKMMAKAYRENHYLSEEEWDDLWEYLKVVPMRNLFDGGQLQAKGLSAHQVRIWLEATKNGFSWDEIKGTF